MRAYSILEIKSVDDAERILTGIASTPDVDRLGDVIEPLGISFKNPIPLLLFHDTRLPVGIVEFHQPTAKGLTFRARMPEIPEAGALRERVKEAWQSIRAGLIRGVSIGFRALPDGIEMLKGGGLRFLKTEVLELSLVAVPANAAASIDAIKSADAALLPAAFGREGAASRPGGTGTTSLAARKSAPAMKTNTEKKTQWMAERAAKVARMNEIMSGAEGETLDEGKQEEFDGLKEAIANIDRHLSNLEVLDAQNLAQAKAIDGKGTDEAAASRDPKKAAAPVISVQANAPAGIAFARSVLCRAAAFLSREKGENTTPLQVARERYPDDSRLHLHLKAAVAPASTLVPAWAGELVDTSGVAAEFLEYIRPLSLIGRIPGLGSAPFFARIVMQTTGGDGYWVGEGKPKPLTKFDLAGASMPHAKVAAITVITEELARFSRPSAEAWLRGALAEAINAKIDVDFIDPAKAAVATVSPASITNGVAPLTSAGNEPADVLTDVQKLIAALTAANGSTAGIVLLMPTALASALAFMTNDFGTFLFPSVQSNGGTLRGVTIVASDYLARGGATGNIVVGLIAPQVMVADDGSVTVDASREASLEMDSAPTQVPPAGASLVSLWQNNLIALRAERHIAWMKARPNSVAWIGDVKWGQPELP